MNNLLCGDVLKVLPTLPDKSVDLVFGSPPYETARTYGIGFALKGQEWVDWMVQVYKESLRVCNGLVAFVVQGPTRQRKWTATPALLMADLHRAGICLRRPAIFYRYGVPGSGGNDWLKCNHEYIICATNGGKLSWANNTAMGHVPKYGPGGPCSNRLADGSRVNQWGCTGKQTDRQKDGQTVHRDRPSHRFITVRREDGHRELQPHKPPTLCNPGDVIECGAMGKGHMGSDFAHENEAPFPEKLAEFFIRSFCAPGGVVLDPFLGSGTTIAVAQKTGRNWIGVDVRQSQLDLTTKRLLEETNYGQKELEAA